MALEVYEMLQHAGWALHGPLSETDLGDGESQIEFLFQLRDAQNRNKAEKLRTYYKPVKTDYLVTDPTDGDVMTNNSNPVYHGCKSLILQVEVVEPLSLRHPPLSDLKSQSKTDAFHLSQRHRLPRIRPLRGYDEPGHVRSVKGIFPCNKCAVCRLSRQVFAATNMRLECETAARLGNPVTFWTLTLSSALLFNGKSRSDVPIQDFKRMLYAFRTHMSKRYGARVVLAIEPHKDGSLHAHALLLHYRPSDYFGPTADKNRHGSSRWIFHQGVEAWPHGRTEIVQIQPQDVPKTGSYLAKYAVKGANLAPEIETRRQSIDGTSWQSSQLSYPRKPGLGIAEILEIARSHGDEAMFKGYEMFAENPLDTYRCTKVNDFVQSSFGAPMVKSLTTSRKLLSTFNRLADAQIVMNHTRTLDYENAHG